MSTTQLWYHFDAGLAAGCPIFDKQQLKTWREGGMVRNGKQHTKKNNNKNKNRFKNKDKRKKRRTTWKQLEDPWYYFNQEPNRDQETRPSWTDREVEPLSCGRHKRIISPRAPMDTTPRDPSSYNLTQSRTDPWSTRRRLVEAGKHQPSMKSTQSKANQAAI